MAMVCLLSNFANAGPGDLKWSIDLNAGDVATVPAVNEDGTIYIGTIYDGLMAYSINGSHLWTYDTNNNYGSSPVIGQDGTVYIGSSDDSLYAINSDGSLQWTFTTGGNIYSTPALGQDGTIYIGSDDNKFYAVNPDGTQKWVFQGGSDFSSGAAVAADGTIYAASEYRDIYALNPDGSLKWQVETGGYNYSSPSIDAIGTVYVGSTDNKMYAFNSDGTPKWVFETNDDIESSAAVDSAGNIIFGSEDRNLYSVSSSGSINWVYATNGSIYTTPVIGADDSIYFGSRDDVFYALSSTGQLLWSADDSFSDFDASGTLVSDGTLYVGNDNDELIAFETSTSLAQSAWPKEYGNVKNTGLAGDASGQVTASLTPFLTNINTTGQCPEMEMTVTVLDSYRNNISGLTADDFGITVNGSPVDVNTVNLVSDVRSSVLNVAFTLDYSGSMGSDDITSMETAASQFVSYMQLGDQASIIKFSSNVDVMLPFTDDLALAMSTIPEGYSGEGGQTALYDSVYQALSNVSGQSGRQVVVAMSDGSDNNSSFNIDEVVDYANQLGIVIYTVTLGSGDRDAMNTLASRTGGLSYYSPTSTELEDIYQTIVTSIQSQYVVTFTDPTSGTSDNNIEVSVTDDLQFGSVSSTYDSCRDYNTGINQIVEYQCPLLEAVVSVYDQNGVPLDGLGINSFDLYLDGTASDISSVTQVQSATSKTTFAIVMDYSASMSANDIDSMQTAAKLIIDNKADLDEGVIVKFSDQPSIVQSLTADGALLSAAIDAQYSNHGATALYDAIDTALNDIAGATGRKAIIVLTDGDDTVSGATLDSVIANSNQQDIPVFTIGLGQADATVLQELANRTYGIYYYAPDNSDLASIYSTLSDVLQSQYLITFADIFADQMEHTAVINTVVQGRAISSSQRSFLSCAAPASNSIGFESGDASLSVFTLSGDENWEVSDIEPIEGSYSMKVPEALDNYEMSTAELTLQSTDGDMSFDVKVDSEGNFDILRFYIDDVFQAQWSGSRDTETAVYPVTNGTHTFKWEFTKDGSVSNGQDTAWVDNIAIPGIDNSTDSDGDGVADSIDAFPNDGFEWLDTDGDGIGNNSDLDDDNDGVPDSLDAFPHNPLEWLDTDGDGIGNNADNDDDGDGIVDLADPTPLGYAAINDVNGDGKSDLLWRSFAKGWNFLWTMDGTQLSDATPINVVQEYTWRMEGQGDYDGDGKSDIFWRNSDTGKNFIYLMDGANIKDRYALNYVTAGVWELAGSGDFNGDGTGDVLWRNVNRGDTWFYMMNNGFIGVSQPSLWVTDLNYEIAATGDLDGDGDDDILWRHSATGVNYVWLMEHGDIADRYTLNTVNTNWNIAGTGDLNGDGTDDIIMRNNVDGRNWAYFMNDGMVSASSFINEVADLNWKIANIGDYDGDGKDDFLWRNEVTSRNIIHLMDNTTIKDRGVLRPTDNNWQVAK
tara:strand:+ start:26547 stop:30890 length:4344 start_codon:yes stop_codon:yes gene_type:complete